MTDSLKVTQLIDWLEGRLTEEEDLSIAAAVQADESLQTAVAWLQTFLNVSSSAVLLEPPADLLQEAKAKFQAFARGKRQAGWLQTLVATLLSDSWQRSSLVSVRRTGFEAVPRQLVFRADAADIVLNTQAGSDEDRLDLVGQVFPLDESDPASFTVQIIHRELEVALTGTNSVGRFTCADLEAGAYTIVIRGDEVEITIPDVDLSV